MVTCSMQPGGEVSNSGTPSDCSTACSLAGTADPFGHVQMTVAPHTAVAAAISRWPCDRYKPTPSTMVKLLNSSTSVMPVDLMMAG
jgi:hypothetical protein